MFIFHEYLNREGADWFLWWEEEVRSWQSPRIISRVATREVVHRNKCKETMQMQRNNAKKIWNMSLHCFSDLPIFSPRIYCHFPRSRFLSTGIRITFLSILTEIFLFWENTLCKSRCQALPFITCPRDMFDMFNVKTCLSEASLATRARRTLMRYKRKQSLPYLFWQGISISSTTWGFVIVQYAGLGADTLDEFYLSSTRCNHLQRCRNIARQAIFSFLQQFSTWFIKQDIVEMALSNCCKLYTVDCRCAIYRL